MTIKKGDVFELKIDKLVFGGAGLGRFDGQVVFVDYSAPGDLLKIEIIESKKNFSRGKILEIINPSYSRTKPKCRFFGKCGGCQWQHINYEEQLFSKQKIIENIINKIPIDEDTKVGVLQPSPDIYNYRNRIQVRTDENGVLGFFEKGTHNLVEIDRCEIAEEPLNQELIKLKNEKLKKGKFRIQIGIDNKVSRTQIDEQDDALGFAQINKKQNQYLQNEVLNTYKEYSGLPIVDLYGGYGNFSLPLAEKYPNVKIECVEWSHKSVKEGIRIAELHNLSNLRYINSDVLKYLDRIKIDKDSFVILDPPRDGCDSSVIKELTAKSPKCIVYISCDPMTWSRDVQLFFNEAREKGIKYRIATIHGLDMFPQTDHIEVFSVFERKG